MMDKQPAPQPIEELLKIMAQLRDPDEGCPWDKEQTYATIAPYTIEEAYEVADAIDRGDKAGLVDELGDLLFQVVFYAQIAHEDGTFEFDDVVRGISEKMLRRHPHVFGEAPIDTTAAQNRAWEAQKAEERRANAKAEGREASALDGVAQALPALMRAQKIQKRAARVGFDWPDIDPVFAKIDEEIGEIREEIADGASADRLEDEVGDLLFSAVNLARHLGVDAEAALRGATAKFDGRFRALEMDLAGNDRNTTDATLAEMDAIWTRVKSGE